MSDHLAGKTLIITGAGGGFGGKTAEQAAARGANVLCADIDGAAAEATAAGIRAAGGAAVASAVDVTRIDDMRSAVRQAVERWGGVDVLVNNAGIMPLSFLSDHEAALGAWMRCVDINFKGVVNGTVAVFDQMMARGSGHIVNISSIYGNHPVVGAAVYGATKAAVDYFSQSVRQEGRGKIKVTLIKPAGVPSTSLAGTVVNAAGGIGIVGQNAAAYIDLYRKSVDGTLPARLCDVEDPAYFSLTAADVAGAIVHAIDQPLGVTLSDITVRATGDFYIL